jgi:hypothetical protein
MKEIRQFFIGHGATVVFPLGDIPLGVHADSLQSISSRRDRLMLVRWGVVGTHMFDKTGQSEPLASAPPEPAKAPNGDPLEAEAFGG